MRMISQQHGKLFDYPLPAHIQQFMNCDALRRRDHEACLAYLFGEWQSSCIARGLTDVDMEEHLEQQYRVAKRAAKRKVSTPRR